MQDTKQAFSKAALPLILMMGLSGCFGGKEDDMAQVGRAMMMPQTAVPQVEPCAASQWRDQLLDRRDGALTRLSLPAGHRVLRPGSLVTADMDDRRMTVTVNSRGVIDGVYCG